MRPAARSLVAVLAAAVVALSGCGIGPGDSPDEPIALTVTRDFGARSLVALDKAKVSGADTVMRVTQRNAKVGTRFGGDFVQSISGVSGGRRSGRPVDWFIYLNGILTDQGASAIDVHGGDRIWWDHHDWGTTPDIRVVVGSFPEPFLHGIRGTRLPVRVACASPRAASCGAVADRLSQAGVEASTGALRGAAGARALRVLVGTWQQLRASGAQARSIDVGPKASGVFARFDAAGSGLALLDERGRSARRLGAGSGLIAATRQLDGEPVWFVTGTDDAGVASAARAFREPVLRDRFAVAVSGGAPVGVPLVGGADDGSERG